MSANVIGSATNRYMQLNAGQGSQVVGGVGVTCTARIQWFLNTAGTNLTLRTVSSADGQGGSSCDITGQGFSVQINGGTTLNYGGGTYAISTGTVTSLYIYVYINVRGNSGIYNASSSGAWTFNVVYPPTSLGTFNVNSAAATNFTAVILPDPTAVATYSFLQIVDSGASAGSKAIYILDVNADFYGVSSVGTNSYRTVVYSTGTYWYNYQQNVNIKTGNAVPGFNFVDTSTQTTIISMPTPSTSNKGILYWIKDTTHNASTNNITIFTGSAKIDDDQYRGTDQVINNANGCLVLSNDGSNWYVMNYYNGVVVGGTSDMAGNNTAVTAVVGKVNIYTSSGNPRSAYNSRVNMPTAVSGGICIVVYAGQNNASLIFYASGNNLDPNWYNNSNNMPYINVDDNNKCTGIIFISDGTNWYIAGWAGRQSCWAWEVNATVSGVTTNANSGISGLYSSITIAALDWYDNRLMLPNYDSSKTAGSYFKIVKMRIEHTYGIIVHSDQLSSGVNCYQNNTFNCPPAAKKTRIWNSCTNLNQYNCMWFVSSVDNGHIRWYPIIEYYRH